MRRNSSFSLMKASMRAATSISCCVPKRWRRTSMSTSRHPRESGGPAKLEGQRDSRFGGNDELALPMTGDGCRAELFSDEQRDRLRNACAEDREIWDIYANNFGPDGF